jgi:hypothetical protein
MWDIRSVNKIYVDNLRPTSIEETCWNFDRNFGGTCISKKTLPENFQYTVKKNVEKSGLLHDKVPFHLKMNYYNYYKKI